MRRTLSKMSKDAVSSRTKQKCVTEKVATAHLWNGTMFGDLDWPLNASRGLSAIAEFLVLVSRITQNYSTDFLNIRWKWGTRTTEESVMFR